MSGITLNSNDNFKLELKGKKFFIEESKEFIEIPDTTLTLEHSLVSLHRWESIWHKPFLSTDKTNEEMLSYIKCMVIEDFDETVLLCLTEKDVQEIKSFIGNPMTATVFSQVEGQSKGNARQIITAEILYYDMIGLQIPVEFEHWHLNKLTTLIKVCNEKNSPSKKMSTNQILKNNSSLNAARRKALGTKG